MEDTVYSILEKPIHLRSRKELQYICHWFEVERPTKTITIPIPKLEKLPELKTLK